MADGDPIIFTELTGHSPRTVVLAGPDRPERPVRVGGKQRLVTSWYPGAEEASVQVLGTEEDPIALRGVLNDRWTGIDGGALAKRNELDALRVRQRRIRMTWGTTIDVEGFLQSFAAPIHRTSLIFYELSFMVALGDRPEAIAVTPFPQSTESDLAEALSNGVNFIDKGEAEVKSRLAELLDSISAVL